MASQSLSLAFLFLGGFGLIGILLTIFWLWMLIDCLTNSSINGTEKIVWVLVILFTHFIGALIYFFVARGGRTRPLV